MSESIEQTTPEQPSQFETPPAALPVHEKSGDVAIYLVEFKGSRKDHYRDPYHLPIRIGDRVIVQVERGEDLGRVVLRPSPKDAAAAKVKPLPILRIAGKTELEQSAANCQKEDEARRQQTARPLATVSGPGLRRVGGRLHPI